MRQGTPWQIQTIMDSTHEIKPVCIDKDWHGDGLIVFRPTLDEATGFLERGIPVVNVSSEFRAPGIPNVLPNNQQCGSLAANHFLERGIRTFAFYGDESREYSRDREAGYHTVIEKAGFPYHRIDVAAHKLPWPRRWEYIHHSLRGQLQQLPTPIGIFAKDDIAAANVIAIVTELGMSIPEDVAVLGMNSDEIFCHTTMPPLSSIRYPGYQIGFQAALILSQMLGDRNFKPDPVYPIPVSEIVVRESTNRFSYTDTIVERVIHRIRTQAPSYPLRVKEIVNDLPLSKAAFIKRFSQSIGHSPKEEISRVRTAEAKRLLEQKDWTVSRIAIEMGFESPEEFGRFFKRRTELKPTEYRRQFLQLRPERITRAKLSQAQSRHSKSNQ